jgi:hypothetical protein
MSVRQKGNEGLHQERIGRVEDKRLGRRRNVQS